MRTTEVFSVYRFHQQKRLKVNKKAQIKLIRLYSLLVVRAGKNVVPDPLIFEGFLNIKVVNAISHWVITGQTVLLPLVNTITALNITTNFTKL